MLKKICFSPDSDFMETHSMEKVSANPKILEKFTKLAKNLKGLAPRSDDFLYFSIIFLKSAESALLDENGSIKKVGSEDAWGFFDENWKWHGNVKPHRNNNKDIFPESQLKIAAPLWVGKPLCRDHESSSVDGIRGIILDTYYDDKFKQVVGLCALDKVNYPDLARKVSTGMVRYGSMGTAVETSICTECGNKATTQSEYCDHITSHAAHGEINVGLKPIEYSLVVQPAEPGAVLLRCIASLNEYKEEFINYGVGNVSEMLGKLSEKQAEHLSGIMKMACGESGCSISERKKIVTSFLSNNGLLKTSGAEEARNIAESTKVMLDPDTPDHISNQIERALSREDDAVDQFTDPSTAYEDKLPGEVESYLSTGREGLTGAKDNGNLPDFQVNEQDPISYVNNDYEAGGASVSVAAADRNDTGKIISNSVSNIDKLTISSILEDIMNESRLRKRAELRRRIAYMQGGAEGVEPNTYKSEDYNRDQDKQMQQGASMGAVDGMFPGDSETKEKLSRAELNERRLKRMAYMQGGAEGVEPNTYKSEDWNRDQDKQMQQGASMGAVDGMFPGDAETKEKLSRASEEAGMGKVAYNGPSLSTRFLVKTKQNGTVDRAGSVFQVFSGDNRVISATASEIFGPELDSNWEWLKSRDYGKEVCKQIRTAGLNTVAGLLKSAQAAPELPPMPGADAAGADAGAMPPMDDAMPPMDDAMPPMDDAMPETEEEDAQEDESADPATEIDNRLAGMEDLINEVRDLVDQLKDSSSADVDVNVFTSGGDEEVDGDEGLSALSSNIRSNLKTVYARLDNSADELSMVAETYDNINKLSSEQAREFRKLASAAVKEADQITGEAKAVVKIAVDVKNTMTKTAKTVSLEESAYSESSDATASAQDNSVEDLMASAMELRKSRREALLKQAEDRVLAQRRQAREDLLKNAEPKEKDEENVSEEAAADDMTAGEAMNAMDGHGDMAEDHAGDHHMAADMMSAEASNASPLKQALADKVAEKRADEVREQYRVKLRRAYDVGMEMQRKGLLPTSKASLDRQVDEIMDFDDKAFESFKRSIANAKPVRNVKVASDLGGVNVGVNNESAPDSSERLTANSLSLLWD